VCVCVCVCLRAHTEFLIYVNVHHFNVWNISDNTRLLAHKEGSVSTASCNHNYNSSKRLVRTFDQTRKYRKLHGLTFRTCACLYQVCPLCTSPFLEDLKKETNTDIKSQDKVTKNVIICCLVSYKLHIVWNNIIRGIKYLQFRVIKRNQTRKAHSETN